VQSQCIERSSSWSVNLRQHPPHMRRRLDAGSGEKGAVHAHGDRRVGVAQPAGEGSGRNVAPGGTGWRRSRRVTLQCRRRALHPDAVFGAFNEARAQGWIGVDVI
jgi:hypothetical protein